MQLRVVYIRDHSLSWSPAKQAIQLAKNFFTKIRSSCFRFGFGGAYGTWEYGKNLTAGFGPILRPLHLCCGHD